jgi:hypothetical protein
VSFLVIYLFLDARRPQILATKTPGGAAADSSSVHFSLTGLVQGQPAGPLPSPQASRSHRSPGSSDSDTEPDPSGSDCTVGWVVQ